MLRLKTRNTQKTSRFSKTEKLVCAAIGKSKLRKTISTPRRREALDLSPDFCLMPIYKRIIFK